MNSLDSWNRATINKQYVPRPLPVEDRFGRFGRFGRDDITATTVLFGVLMFLLAASWPIIGTSEHAKTFLLSGMMAAVPASLVLLVCRLSHSDEGKRALWGVVILVAFLLFLALLF